MATITSAAATTLRLASPNGLIARTVLPYSPRNATPLEAPMISLKNMFSADLEQRKEVAQHVRSAATTTGVFTAPQEKRLPLQCQVQSEWISTTGRKESILEVASTLAQHRAQHEFRAAFVVDDHSDAANLLSEYAQGKRGDWTSQARILANDVSKGVVWIFSGHGAQWANMGKELVLDPVFRDAIMPVNQVVSDELGWSVVGALDKGNFSSTEEIQVLTYAMQVSLGQVLLSQGMQPQALIGHSVGEIAAAVTAGCITPEEGAIVVARRARLYMQVCGKGGMYLVNRSFTDVASELKERTDIVAAIDSSPSSCVISGLLPPLQAYADDLRKFGVKVMRVKTDVGFHSPSLESLMEPLRVSLHGAVQPTQGTIPLYSTSQADPRSKHEKDVDYWVNNMVSPVRLTDAVAAAAEDGFRLFAEVSSHPVVQHSVNETLLEKNLDDFAVVGTLRRDKPAAKSILHAIAQLYAKGAHVDFDLLCGRAWSSKVPGFAWSHKPYWRQVETPNFAAQAMHEPGSHSLIGHKTTIAGTQTCMYQSELHVDNQPFPQPHMLHGTNILPAAVHVCTLLQAAGINLFTLSRISLKVPLSITEDPRIVQVVRERDSVKLLSRPAESAELAWVMHSAASLADSPTTPHNSEEDFDIASIKERIGTMVQPDFATKALKDVGVEGMAFPWQVRSHYSNGVEMLVEVDSDPSREIMARDPNSWAPMLDAATSISFSLLADDPKLRIVSSIDSVTIRSETQPPKAFYLYITEVSAHDEHTRATNVAILDMHGIVVAHVKGVALTEVHGASGIHSSRSMEKLVHRIAWIPAQFSEKPLDFAQAVVVSSDRELREEFAQQLQKHVSHVKSAASVHDVQIESGVEGIIAIVYCPPPVAQLDEIATGAHTSLCTVAEIVRFTVENTLSAKVFVITNGVFTAVGPTALAQGPLYGLARVAASEHPDLWGGLIDSNGPDFPFVPFRYVHGQDIIRFVDGVPWVARLRPITADRRATSSKKTLLPRPDGTYIVTGGFGDLGLETCDFLVEKGARRLVLISRRVLPPRKDWPSASSSWTGVLQRIQAMEKLGATMHAVSLDIGADDAHERLLDALSKLSLPPVRVVVHAAGVVEDGLLLNTSAESFERVLSPKLSGALTLHRAFSPGALDFFVLFSSVGQLVGLPGQSSYASANAFLDCLADHRRRQGDNSVAFLWTAWRKLGMGASDLVLLECHGRGISDIERDEGFAAWEYMERYDLSQCVVSPTLIYGKDEAVPAAILEDVAERRQASDEDSKDLEDAGSNSISGLPADASELRSWIDLKIRECVATVMKFDDAEEIDSRLALSEIGVDSVVSIPLRQRLQDTFKTKVPQTIVWNYPTIESQVEWFAK